jgi:hypothetical protein
MKFLLYYANLSSSLSTATTGTAPEIRLAEVIAAAVQTDSSWAYPALSPPG